MWEELGISGGTAIIVLIAFYFVIKWAVKNGINESVLGKAQSNKATTFKELKKVEEELLNKK